MILLSGDISKDKLTPLKTRNENVSEYILERKHKSIKFRPKFMHISFCCKFIPMTYEEAEKYNIIKCVFANVFNDCGKAVIKSVHKMSKAASICSKSQTKNKELMFICLECKIGLCEKCMVAPNSKFLHFSPYHVHPLLYFRINGCNAEKILGFNRGFSIWQCDIHIKGVCEKPSKASFSDRDISIRCNKCNFDVCKACFVHLSSQ